MMRFRHALLSCVLALSCATGQTLPIPSRLHGAPGGTALADTLSKLTREERERAILREVLGGNIPPFQRRLVPVTITDTSSRVEHRVTFFAIPDYLALGSDEDHLLIPMTPICAQQIATALGCLLPTRRMVDEIWSHAAVRLRPQPIPPGPLMTTVPVFVQHNDSVRSQRKARLKDFPLGMLTAGHKKDIIISDLITRHLKKDRPHPVVIYGWHQLDGTPIQLPFNGHDETYADYSHGVRLVLDRIVLDGAVMRLSALLRDPVRSFLLSDEGVIAQPFYRIEPTDTVRGGEK